MMEPQLRVGVDIGGTFTDLVIMNQSTGQVRFHKVLSTPKAPAVGMLKGLDETGVIKDTGFLVHGTTAGLNAILSGAGDRIALVTTEGFADVLEIGRGENRDVWSLSPVRRKLLVAPEDVLTVSERLRHDGTVKTPLRTDDVVRVADRLGAEGITSVAVCFLHAHKNPVHELEFRRLLKERLPNVSVVLSHEISPEQGEYERTSSVVATAYVSRTIDTYLSELQRELRARSCPAPLHVMRSSGGICSAELVARQPIQTILSGPAGGVVAAETISKALNRPNLIAIDMGGTSSDVSLVIDGRMTLASEGEIADNILRMPVVELHTIGAGGGSIARAEGGGLRVGPQSAGSNPGPACYGLGGTQPTVTDAQVFLGRIDPQWFLGGRMQLDLAAAQKAITGLAAALGTDEVAAAEGIVDVANAMMANAIRTLAMRRGIDHRKFTLVAFGGAGPLHGAALAAELGIDEVIVPFGTGVLSAWGMLHADIRHDVSLPLEGFVGDAGAEAMVERARVALMEKAAGLLAAEGVATAESEYRVTIDMRYVGQSHAVPVELQGFASLADDFHAQYRRQFSHAMPEVPVEMVQMRLGAIGRIGARFNDRTEPPTPQGEQTRKVVIGRQEHAARIVHRDAIGGSESVTGPAIILEDGSTTLVPPGWRATQEKFGTLIIGKVQP